MPTAGLIFSGHGENQHKWIMKTKDMRHIGFMALAAGLVLVPLTRYLLNRRKGNKEGPVPHAHKRLFSAYFAKHRKALHDGHFHH